MVIRELGNLVGNRRLDKGNSGAETRIVGKLDE
jgi:hypothetical protein